MQIRKSVFTVRGITLKPKKCIGGEKVGTKVVGNDPSYCSNYFLFWWNLKDEGGRAKKNVHFFYFIGKIGQNQGL